MIITQFQGGLGNQLFEYAAALIAAQGDATQIQADLSYYAYVPHRHYCLNKLGVKLDPLSFWQFPLEVPLSWPLAGKSWRSIYPWLGSFQIYQEQSPYHFDQRLSHLEHSTYLAGFWQHRRYPDSLKKTLKSKLIFPAITSQAGQKVKLQLKQPASVSVHVRRGDYLRDQSFNVCTVDYYRSAIRYFNSKSKGIRFYFFSDDMAWCKETFAMVKNTEFIEKTADEVEDLYLMSLCQHHIIANSTFSWWGAWLGKRAGMTVAPKRWKVGQGSNTALIYPNWITL